MFVVSVWPPRQAKINVILANSKCRITLHNTRIQCLTENVVKSSHLIKRMKECKIKLDKMLVLKEDTFMTLKERT